MILVLSRPDDVVGDAGERLLRQRGADVVRFDPGRIPDDAGITLRWQPRSVAGRQLTVDGRSIDLAEIGAVWHRRARPVRAGGGDPRIAAFAGHESDAVLRQLWLELGVPFLPAPLSVIRAGQDKLRQLSLATSLGLEIPASIVTTEPAELLAFHREHDGHIITKLISHASVEDSQLDRDVQRMTERMTWFDVAAAVTARRCPVYAQAYVPKRLELRITVVGVQVFAVEIHSQKARHTRHDWRRYDHGRVPHVVHQLPDEVAAHCLAMTRCLGLRYGALDFVLTPDGRYVFLEINPAGEYHWIEQLTGLPITAAIVDLLIELDSGRAGSEAP